MRREHRNATIDVLRIILAILVVYIHLNGTLYGHADLDGLSLVFDDIYLILARTAVPIFFAISGYCLFRNNKKSERASVKRSLRHLLLLIIECVFLYTMVNIILFGAQQTASRFTPNRIYQLLFLNSTGGLLNAPMAWFLLALILCCLIFYVYPWFTVQQKYIALAAIVSYVWSISISPTYGGIVLDKEPSMLYRNYLTVGLPFFTLGYFYHKYQSQICNAISKQTVKFTALAFALYAIEQVIYLSGGHRRYPMEISIMMPLVVVGVLMLATQHPRLLAKTKFPAWSAKYSLYLYIGHTAVINILSKYLFDNEPPASLRYYKVLLLYVAVVAITLLASFAYVHIKKLIVKLFAKHNISLAITNPNQTVKP